jgi:dUTPase
MEYTTKVRVNKVLPDSPSYNKMTRQKPFLLLRSMKRVLLYPNTCRAVRTGIKVSTPSGSFGHIQLHRYLSQLGLFIVSPIIRPGFDQEVVILCHNRSTEKIRILTRQKLAWVVFAPYCVPERVEMHDDFETEKLIGGLRASAI